MDSIKTIQHKRCSKCKKVKLLCEFHKNKAQKTGYHSQCKDCVKEYNDYYRLTRKGKSYKENYRREHKDGNKLNNSLENLELVTTKENALHAHRMGLINSARGEQIKSAKLVTREVREIRQLYDGGLSTRKIAPMFEISYHQVWMIVRRKNWRHV